MKIKSIKLDLSGYSTGCKTKIKDKWKNTDTSGPSSALKENPQQTKNEKQTKKREKDLVRAAAASTENIRAMT